MSDTAITQIAATAVTIATMLFGFLTLLVKLRYGNRMAEVAAEKADVAVGKALSVEGKIDDNTALTKAVAKNTGEALPVLNKIERQTNGGLDARLEQIADHAKRIGALEGQMAALKVSVDSASKNVDSTRHEVRGHMQTVMNKLDLLALGAAQAKKGEAT
jgi:hypothetical protein